MTTEQRIQNIMAEYKRAEKKLVECDFLSGIDCLSDVYQLPDGRKAQIRLEVTIDESEFEELTNSFTNDH